jgi:hypothetical protein
MPGSFDYCYKWLGIPSEAHQPSRHRLPGVFLAVAVAGVLAAEAASPSDSLSAEASSDSAGPARTSDSAALAFADARRQRVAAIAQGLQWLAGRQEQDGNWLFATAPNPGTRPERVGATSLALLPFLLAGHTHKSGEHSDVVAKGIKFLGKQGKLSPKTGLDLRGEGGDMYTHALATMVLCEAQRRTRDKLLRKPAEAAVKFILYAQDPKGGGWRYLPRQPGDTSVLGWQFSALVAAQEANIRLPSQTLLGVDAFLNSVQANQGASYGYDQPGGGEPTRLATTAIGLFCRTYRGWKKDHPQLKEGVERIAASGPSGNVYFNLYATRLLHRYGEDEWDAWKSKMGQWLLDAQEKAGPTAGSWFVEAPRDLNFVAPSAGRLGVTALCLMTLQELDAPAAKVQ